MSPEEILKHLEQRVDLLQRRITELGEQREEIERQIKNYKELMRYYRGVFEAEQGVGIQNQISVAGKDGSMEDLISKITKDSEEKPSAPRITPRKPNIRWAMNQILETANEPLSTMQLCQLIAERYPDIAGGSKNLFHTVEATLWRGCKQHTYEWVNKGLYRLKREK